MANQTPVGRSGEAGNIRVLRWIHSSILPLLWTCLWGMGCVMAGGVCCLGLHEFGSILALVGVWMAMLAFSGIVGLMLIQVSIVFFCYARYSLGAMLLAVLASALGVSLMVMKDPVTELVGGLLVLGVLGVVIAEILGRFDPVEKTERSSGCGLRKKQTSE